MIWLIKRWRGNLYSRMRMIFHLDYRFHSDESAIREKRRRKKRRRKSRKRKDHNKQKSNSCEEVYRNSNYANSLFFFPFLPVLAALPVIPLPSWRLFSFVKSHRRRGGCVPAKEPSGKKPLTTEVEDGKLVEASKERRKLLTKC